MISSIRIRRPLSPGGKWVEVSLYRSYADSACEHLTAGRFFDAVVVSCVGFDVLVNALPDRIRLHHFEKLTAMQQKIIRDIEMSDRQTAGQILDKLISANILHNRLARALNQFNQARNRVIHPIERQTKIDAHGVPQITLGLKENALVPPSAKKEDAEKYYRCFCHIIDLCGGESPRNDEKASRIRTSLSEQLIQLNKERRFRGSSQRNESS